MKQFSSGSIASRSRNKNQRTTQKLPGRTVISMPPLDRESFKQLHLFMQSQSKLENLKHSKSAKSTKPKKLKNRSASCKQVDNGTPTYVTRSGRFEIHDFVDKPEKSDALSHPEIRATQSAFNRARRSSSLSDLERFVAQGKAVDFSDLPPTEMRRFVKSTRGRFNVMEESEREESEYRTQSAVLPRRFKKPEIARTVATSHRAYTVTDDLTPDPALVTRKSEKIVGRFHVTNYNMDEKNIQIRMLID
eukprot:875664_1